MRILCKSKIHRATITNKSIDYEGSITIDKRLMEEAIIVPYEKVQVVNISNGIRFDTYAIEGKVGSGEICLNGAAARLGEIGDKVILITYCTVDDNDLASFKPTIVNVNDKNQPK